MIMHGEENSQTIKESEERQRPAQIPHDVTKEGYLIIHEGSIGHDKCDSKGRECPKVKPAAVREKKDRKAVLNLQLVASSISI